MLTSGDRGIALVATLLVMLLVSTLLVGFTAAIMSDQRFRGIDRDRVQAFYAAHAGLEKLNADVGNYFQTNFAPTAAQLLALTANAPAIPTLQFTAVNPPSFPGYVSVGPNGYAISFQPDANGNPKVGSSAPVSSGPYQGLIAELTPYEIDVTAKTLAGSEVHLKRSFETVAIPVFQFGMFSSTDLSFFPGSDFTFGGRTHTNGNLFLASGATLTLSDKVTAVGNVIRQNLSNGAAITLGPNTHTGTVSVIQSPGAFRNLAATEGSLTGMVGSAPNPGWTNLSLTTYNGYIRSGLTGATALNLPVITAGGANTDIVRRPASATENVTNPALFNERYFGKVSLRILLSDTAADITGLPTVTATAPVLLDGNWNTAPPNNGTAYGPVSATNPPIARSGGPITATTSANTASGAGTINVVAVPAGFQPPSLTLNGTAVTCTGRTAITFTGCVGTPASAKPAVIAATVNSVAISTTTTANTLAGAATINVASTTGFGPGLFWLANTAVTCTGNTLTTFTGCTGTPATAQPQTISTNYLTPAGTGVIGGYLKIELQDTSFVWHDVTMEILNLGIASPNQGGTICADPNPNAILRFQRLRDNGNAACNYGNSLNASDYWPNALFDAREALQRDAAPGSGAPILGGVMYYIGLDARNLSQWFQGNIGATGSTALSVNGYAVYFSDRRNNTNAANQETGEYGFEDVVNPLDVNGVPNGVMDTGEDVNANGALDTYGQFPSYNGTASTVAAGSTAPLDATARPTTQLPSAEAMVNRAVLFRHALKVFNGRLGNLVAPGLAIVSENPVYLQGDWNATTVGGVGFGNPHVATSIFGDAVTLLSNEWTDLNSFANPYNPAARTRATNPYYRVAIIGGKNLSFPLPAWEVATSDFGTDGGVHNFLRYLESGGTVNYEGSLVSFYYARQAVGIYKCCNTVYTAPTRAYQFDTDFLNPSLLPPMTPVFRDLDTLGFTQEIRPGQ